MSRSGVCYGGSVVAWVYLEEPLHASDVAVLAWLEVRRRSCAILPELRSSVQRFGPVGGRGAVVVL